MFALYEALLGLVFLLVLPWYALIDLLRGKRHGNLRVRFGFDGAASQHHEIWIHAVSVGEVAAARAVAEKIRSRKPGARFLITTTTVTGQATAQQLFPGDTVTYYPFDFGFAIRRFLDRHQPDVYAAMETEIWPNVIRISRSRGLRLLVANGRISDRSYPRYRMARRLVGPLLRLYDQILVREDLDRDRFLAIGAPPDRVEVVGNVKFDFAVSEEPLPFAGSLDAILGQRHLFVAGSTMEGEEALMLPMISRLIPSGVVVALAPRKPDRFDEVARLLERAGIRFVRRSRLHAIEDGADVLLLDSIGELARLYRRARAAFVGGSLVPTGGHNPIEPAAVGTPVAFGPHMSNFREIAATLVRAGAARQVSNVDDLEAFALRMARDDQEHRSFSSRCTST
ncbi:MAG TPA: glycosyltransferase N-terminal domain-containing protein, partial [Thermoanaerobaculia bacterium]|nr:glycosyltransferase N-terminal domain-containing protein [Thermoanaerobaculia bacterium]